MSTFELIEKIKEEITKFAEQSILEDDIDDRCFSAAYAGALKGLEMSLEYTDKEIETFINTLKS